MSEHVGDRAFDLVIGGLDPEEQRALQKHADGCAECAVHLRVAREEAADWLLDVDELAPSAAARARFQEALDDKSPFASLVSSLAHLADMPERAMRELVASLDAAASWMVGPGPGIDVVHVEGGPLTAGAIIGFVRIRKGERFPRHRHVGDESVLVVQGSVHDDLVDEVYGPGDLIERATGTEHTIKAGDEEDLIYLVRVYEGIELDDDDLIGPDDPRI